MRVLITGGCGFIGSHLVEAHLRQDDEVSVVDNLSSGTLDNLQEFRSNPKLEVVESDLIAWKGLKNALLKTDRVYHLSAIVGVFKVLAEPVNVIKSNIIGCEHLFETIKEAGVNPRVIIASSSSVYGSNESPELKEHDSLLIKSMGNALSPYAISKMTQEIIANAYHKEYQIPTTIVRLFNVVGPKQTGRYGMVVPRFTHQACDNSPITVFGDGTQTRSFCDVRDAVTAILLLAQQENTLGEVINVGNDHEISILNLAEMIKERTQSHSEIQYIPYEIAYGVDFNDTTQRRPCLEKLKKLTGFQHQWSLADTVDDLMKRYRG